MKHKAKILTVLLAGTLFAGDVFAGNEDRAGQAGAAELLLNPWARTSGWGGSNVAGVRGLEGQFLNVAGTAFTRKTELLFSHTNYLKGTGIGVNSFGFTQKVGESGVIGLGFMAMNFGEVEVTTTDMPEGGLGDYNINFMNMGISYAKGFTDHIYGGMCIRAISHQIPNAKATGMALDAGIQYVAGKTENVHFGISLKNVGPKMQYSGDGLNTLHLNEDNAGAYTLDQRAESFEMPSQLNIGGAYDYYLGGDTASAHRITLAGTFASNSFTKNEFRLGLEYGFKSFLMLRGGYAFQKGIGTDDMTSEAFRTTAEKGLSAGFTVELPLSKTKGTNFGLDYSYRATQPFDGTHSIGVRLDL